MKITGVETFCLAYDMPYALTTARGAYQTREALLVKVHTSDPDIVGWGESAMWGGPHAPSVSVIERELAPLIVGQDPRRPEYLWEKIYQETYYHGRKGMVPGLPLGHRHRAVGYRWQMRRPAVVAVTGRFRPAARQLCVCGLLPARLRTRRFRGRSVEGARRGLSGLQDEDRQHSPGRPRRRAGRRSLADRLRPGHRARAHGARGDRRRPQPDVRCERLAEAPRRHALRRGPRAVEPRAGSRNRPNPKTSRAAPSWRAAPASRSPDSRPRPASTTSPG